MKNYILIYVWVIGVLMLSMYSCVPPKDEVLPDVKVNFKNKDQQKLYQFIDTRNLDSIHQYLSSNNPTMQYIACMGLASIKEKASIDKLPLLLASDNEDVRVASAYALGQIGDESATSYLLRGFVSTDSTMEYHRTNAAILEAIGKVGNRSHLNNLATIKTYKPTDTLLLLGQSYGIYRYLLRNMVDTVATNLMVRYVTSEEHPKEVRLVASNYLARASNINLNHHSLSLNQAVIREKDSNIKISLILALGKTKEENVIPTLIAEYNRSSDWRIKVNVIKALQNFESYLIYDFIFSVLDHPDLKVSNTAASFFVNNGTSEKAIFYRRKSRDTLLHWKTQVSLLEASLKHTPPFFGKTIEGLNYELRQKYLNSQNPYEQASIIRAMGQYGHNLLFIKKEAFPSNFPVVRTASVEAMGMIANMKGFSNFFGGATFARITALKNYAIEAIQNGDSGMIAEASKMLTTKNIDFGSTIDSTDMLIMQSSLLKMTLPKDIESYNELASAISHIKKKEFTKRDPKNNHPIQWVLYNNLDKDPKATISTEKGDFTIRLLDNHAPGTVTNFIELASKDFFKNKNFHRIVPNFVSQGGGTRGDGYGSPNHTIRSEFGNLHYDTEGYVGMASAGLDTESSQFFITHSPALHLDGRYTIFAKVIEGIENVYKIEEGDIILDVKINNN